MNIVFFGTPPIAAYALDYLAEAGHTILMVVTQPDKPSGRGKKLSASPVKQLALQKNISLLQPESMKDEEVFSILSTLDADIFVVVAYGHIIPRRIFELPRCNTINLHPSLLPLYRGAAPIQWVLLNGEKSTGITVQLINERMDAGDIVLQEELALEMDDTSESLYEKILPLGGKLLHRAVTGLCDGIITPVPQDEAGATYCGKITTEMASLHWQKDALTLHNLIRGMNPRPGAWTSFRLKTLKIWKSEVVDETFGEPGEISVINKKELSISTGKGSLKILELQMEGKRRMSSLDFINGMNITLGEKCTAPWGDR